jgi:hypothetical protein
LTQPDHERKQQALGKQNSRNRKPSHPHHPGRTKKNAIPRKSYAHGLVDITPAKKGIVHNEKKEKKQIQKQSSTPLIAPHTAL